MDEPSGPIDAHVHIWTSDLEKYPLAPGFRRGDLSPRSFTIEEMLAHGRPEGVRRLNLVQMTWYGLDHSYILDAIARDPGHLVGTGIVPAIADVAGPSPDDAMVALAKRGVLAFRIRGRSTRPWLRDADRWLDDPGYDKMFAAAARHKLALSFLMMPDDLPELDRMCAVHPDAPVIVDHLCIIGGGGVVGDEEVDALCRMAGHRSVMVKVGAFYALGARRPPYEDLLPLIRRVVGAFGPERCMWESDSPYQVQPPQSYGAALALIRDRADFLSRGDREQILWKTAESFFFGTKRSW